MTDGTSPKSLLSTDGFASVLATARQRREAAEAERPQRELEHRIDQALSHEFPHIRHDEAFQALARDYVKARHEADEDIASLPGFAKALHDALEQNRIPDEHEPGHEQLSALHGLYPIFQQASAEIDHDYDRIAVRLGLRAPQLNSNGDYWRARVKELRTSGVTGCVDGPGS